MGNCTSGSRFSIAFVRDSSFSAIPPSGMFRHMLSILAFQEDWCPLGRIWVVCVVGPEPEAPLTSPNRIFVSTRPKAN